jgi:hypothetical protein
MRNAALTWQLIGDAPKKEIMLRITVMRVAKRAVE